MIKHYGICDTYETAKKVRVIVDGTRPAPVTDADITVSGSGTNLTLEWENPNDPSLDNVLISWGIAGETQIDAPPLPIQSNTTSNIPFSDVAQDKFYTFSFRTVDYAGNPSASNTVAVYNQKKAYIVPNAEDWNNAVTKINNDGAGKSNAILVTGNFSISGTTANTFYPSGIAVNISGDSSARAISLNSNGNLLRISSGNVQEVTISNLTLQGCTGNNNSLVYVGTDGTFNMNAGSAVTSNIISGNVNGGGVYVNGTFNMNGGTIFGNNGRQGGGVYNNGTFYIVNGTIYGSNEDNTTLRNTATNAGAALYVISGRVAQRGTFNGPTWVSKDDFSINNSTIRVQNGDLVP